MAELSPEMINKLIQDTRKQIGSKESVPVTIGDFNKMLSILEEMTKTLDNWTEDSVDDYIKAVREAIGLDKKNSLIDQLEADKNKEKKEEAATYDKRMSEFTKQLMNELGSIFKTAFSEFYEKSIKSAAKGIADVYNDISTDIRIGISGLKDFVAEGLYKFGGSFRKLLMLDFKGAFLDMFSLVKSSFIALLKVPLKILSGIFWSISKVAGMLYGMAKFVFGFIWNTISVIAKTALKISWYITKFVLKVAYKILSTVASVAFNVIGFITSKLLSPVLFIAGAVALVLIGIYALGAGLRSFFNGESSIFGTIESVFGWIGDTIIDSVKWFFKLNGTFFDIMNEWWLDIWEGETIKINAGIVKFDTGVRTGGGLKDTFNSMFGQTIAFISAWWYGEGQNTFGNGGASKLLKDWFLGEDGKSGFLGTMKDFIFGEGSQSKSFVDLLTEWIEGNEWYHEIKEWIEYSYNIIKDIAESDWFKNTISFVKGVKNINTTKTGYGDMVDNYASGATTALFSIGVATGILDADHFAGADESDMNYNEGKFTGTEALSWSAWTAAVEKLITAKAIGTIRSGGDIDKFIKNISWRNLKGLMPDMFSSRLTQNGGGVALAESLKTDISKLKEPFWFADQLKNIKETEDISNPKYRESHPMMARLEDEYDKIRTAVAFALGGIVTGPTRALIGEAKTPEMVIPLNDRGVNFVHETMSKLQPESSESKDMSNKLEQIINLVKRTGHPTTTASTAPARNTGISMSEMVSKGMLEHRK